MTVDQVFVSLGVLDPNNVGYRKKRGTSSHGKRGSISTSIRQSIDDPLSGEKKKTKRTETLVKKRLSEEGESFLFDSYVHREELKDYSSRESHCYTLPSHGDTPLEKLIRANNEESYQTLLFRFRLVPEDITRRCFEFGIQFFVIESLKFWPLFEAFSEQIRGVPGGYIPSLKSCYIHEEALGHSSFENLPLILLGHAYDHALGQDNFASLKSPVVQGLFFACKQRKSGHQFMSGYSEAGPMQYFAQSMASFFSPRDRLWGKETLKAMDVPMYEYLSCLFDP